MKLPQKILDELRARDPQHFDKAMSFVGARPLSGSPAMPWVPPAVFIRSDMVEKGPKLWKMLHQYAVAWNGNAEDATAFLSKFMRYIPCGTCRRGWREILVATPPDLSSKEGFFAWTVARHNEVNVKLGKPEMDLDAAKPLYFQL